MIDLLLYFFWEASLLVLGLGFASWLLKASPERNGDEGVFITCALGVKLLVGGVVPQTAALFSGSSIAMLSCIAVVAAISGFWLLSRSNFLRGYSSFVETARPRPEVIVAGIALVALAPAVALSYMPLIETDSVAYSSPILKMANGTLNPMAFSGHYVALWESTYIPSFLLSKTTYLFPYISLQASLLFACAAYTISRQVGLSALLAMLLAVAGLFSGHFWGSMPAGAATLKNDAISAAGLLCFAAGILRWANIGTFDRAATTLLSIGLSFAMTKSSGPVPVVMAALVACLLWQGSSKKILRSPGALLIIAVTAMASSGLYYAHNWYTNGSPVFPFAIRLGPIAFDGPVDLSGTKLIDHVRSAEMWSYFFGFDTFYKNKAGFLFPGIFIFSLTLAPVIGLLFGKTSEAKRQIVFLWVLLILAWYIYFGTPWSAGVTPQDYFYIAQQSSMRYAMGAIQLSLIICAVVIALMGRAGKAVVFLLAGIEIVGRAVSHYGYTTLGSYSSMYALSEPVWALAYWWIGLAIVCAGIMMLVRKNRILTGVLAFFILSIFLIPATFDNNKRYWAKDMLAVDSLLGSDFSGGAYTVTTLGSEDDSVSALLVSDALSTTGSRFQFEYMGDVALKNISNVLSKAPSTAIVARCNSGGKITSADLITLDKKLSAQGYSLVAHESCSAVFLKLNFLPLQTQKIPNELPLFPEIPHCVLASKKCDWQDGNVSYFATDVPPAVWHVGSNASELSRVIVDEGITLDMRGATAPSNVASFKLTDIAWQISKKAVKQMTVDSKAPPLIVNNQLNMASWEISTPGPYKVWVEIEHDRPVLNIQALDAAPWLALVLRGPALDEAPGMMNATVSSDMALTTNFEAYDFNKHDKKVNHTALPIKVAANERVNDWFGWSFGAYRAKDYVAITSTDLKAGQIVKISDVRMLSTSWPREVFVGLSPIDIE